MDKLGHLLLTVLAAVTILAAFAVVGVNLRHLNRDTMIFAGVLLAFGYGMGWSADFEKAAAGVSKLAFWRKSTDA